jgi:hypothetical protein
MCTGNWFGRRALKGEDMATPVKSFRRTLQKHRRLAIMGEFITSCTCAACGPDLGDACEKVIHPVTATHALTQGLGQVRPEDPS